MGGTTEIVTTALNLLSGGSGYRSKDKASEESKKLAAERRAQERELQR